MTDIKRLHPTALFIYFLTVILLPMFVLDPVILALSLLGATLCLICVRKSGEKSGILLYSLLFFGITVINPLISHNGDTELFFINNKPVTLEAVIYGAVSAVMIIGILIWFRSFSAVMTGEKLLYLVGSVLPKTSVILCSALRYIPLFKKQHEKIRAAQTAMGLYTADNITDKLKGSARVFSILTTWSLENSIDTADSMKARGYGLKHRTSFTLYKYHASDIIFTIITVLLAASAITFAAVGGLSMQFYPNVALPETTTLIVASYISYGALALLPAVLEITEILKWRYLTSRI
ncbi:MAG: energy-coupling factor transporter transmembrane protein EcfT [Clostridia bacterium]|nr:energy-coupling factor transporter transmembrane protein EcfT [Clostridia bacterium]